VEARGSRARGIEEQLEWDGVAHRHVPGEVEVQVIGSSILPALIYGGIAVLYLSVRKRLERKEGGFSLGRFEVPVAIAAIVWVAIAFFALVSPGTSLVPDLVVVGLILAGGLYFANMLIFNREVLDTEPGIPDAF
jgi:hypothetical protein